MSVSLQVVGVSVNHNTSAYMELMLRSLFARHAPPLPLALTVLDNGSTDDTGRLRDFAARHDVAFKPSGFPLDTTNNSHGEILSRFVLDHPDASHYLFLDADVCFLEDDTLGTLLRELGDRPDAFGIGPRLSWDGQTEIPQAARDANPDICDARLHPCCALVRNTPLFRKVVETVGLACARYLWAERDEYLDTFKLMTRVMATHGQTHARASAMVLHFFCVSYAWDAPELAAGKARHRDARLAELRRLDDR